ncbi:MAG: hypothetical protein IK115_08570 [Lachnospiraceae bacterium]|nr:hypothetical protein [Lachnospiraceae bacterium]
MRFWFKLWKDTRLKRDLTIESNEKDSRTHKVFLALEEAVHAFDLSVPIWLDKNIRDFKRSSRCRFTQDSFLEPLEYDYLEMIVLEEDDPPGQ